jgi:hypothetical protein
VKPAAELDKARVLEKLEIERRYWQEQGIDWGIITEKDIQSVLVRNIAWGPQLWHAFPPKPAPSGLF